MRAAGDDSAYFSRGFLLRIDDNYPYSLLIFVATFCLLVCTIGQQKLEGNKVTEVSSPKQGKLPQPGLPHDRGRVS